MLRRIILAILGVTLVAGAYMIAQKLAEGKNRPQPKPQKKVASVFVDTVRNSSTPITIATNGNLMAKTRVELFAEVQGVFESSARTFKEGVRYGSGETLIRINSDEHRANLRAQKSNLYNQLILLLPDLRLDYEEVLPKWQTYIQNFDMEKSVVALPEFESEQEKLFILGKGIQTTYFNVKNLEERLTKYRIHAPFSGVLTEALVDRGTLVRAGQKLGEFINPNIYELEVAINNSYADLMKVGKSVELKNVEKTNSWTGKVTRVNSKVDAASQMIAVFIQVSGKGLREGMYLEAEVTAKEEQNTYELDRKLLVNNEQIFAVKDTTLELININPIHYKENSVVIRGLKDGAVILAKAVPGAYEGMRVKVFEEEEQGENSKGDRGASL